MLSSIEPVYFIKPVSAFNHENVLYIQSVLTILIFLYCYYQCRANNNLSYVDYVRGIIPIIYSISVNLHYYYHHKNSFNIRLLLIGVLTIIWGLRMVYYINVKLTKRGQFQQDLRWDTVYSFFSPQRPYIWQLFVLIVGNFYQIFSWFLMINMPFYMIYTSHNNKFTSLSFIDYAFSVLYLLSFTIECIADYQMMQFRKIKFKKMFLGHSIMYTHDDITVERGEGDEFAFNGWRYDFLSTGLRKYCCHPNYFGELCSWGILYLFGVVNYRNIDMISILALIGYLSLGFKLYKLAIITEGILAYSYGSYYRYHASVNRFIPWLPQKIISNQSVVDNGDNKNKVDNKIEEEYLGEKCSKWTGDNIWIG